MTGTGIFSICYQLRLFGWHRLWNAKSINENLKKKEFVTSSYIYLEAVVVLSLKPV